jgi:single-stranded-DNA-specific exonuclease
LNAAGRMDDMRYGIICLLSENITEALEHAKNLNTFNEERRFVQFEMQEEADVILNAMQLATEDLPVGLCLFNENWHQGVIGILASRVKERLHRPIIVFTRTSDHELRGSARSVRGVHIRDVIDSIAAQHPNMITKFGGHAMAAGLTLPYQHLAQFQQAFDEEVQKHISRTSLKGVIFSDGELESTNFTLHLAEQLRYIPWGQGFDEPIFDGEFELMEYYIIKQKHIKMRVRPINSQDIFDAIAFNQIDENNLWTIKLNSQLQLAYKLDMNTFRGVSSVQLKVQYINAII